MPRRDTRRKGINAKDVRRGGLGAAFTPSAPSIFDLDVWLRKNGVDISNTNSIQSTPTLSERELVSGSFIIELDAGDYIQLMFAVNHLTLVLNQVAADAVSPATPSVVLTITQVE